MIPDYKPPKTTRPITVEVYALLRSYIDAGCAATARYLEDGGVSVDVLNATRPKAFEMALVLYEFVPSELVSLSPAIAWAEKIGYPLPLADVDRPGWPTFVDRQQLLEALDSVTPDEVRAELGDLDRPPDLAGTAAELPSAAAGGLEWWTIALAAGGVLAWLGRRTLVGWAVTLVPKGVIASVARRLFTALVGVGALAAITFLGKKAVEHVADAGRGLFPIFIGGALVVAVVAGVVYAARRPAVRA